MPLFRRRPKPDPATPPAEPTATPATPPRVLFLDDNPARAEVFLAANPHAVWVQTVAECLAHLEQPWDEVHLDHDLGGEQFVDPHRDDCGMEVVRWICLHDRPHLAPARFLVHSHNPAAAAMMGMQMALSGFRVEVRPFGAEVTADVETEPGADTDPDEPVEPRPSLRSAFGSLLRRVFRRGPGGVRTEFGYGYTATRFIPEGDDDPPPDRLDFDWLSAPKPAKPARGGDESPPTGETDR
jgi:hypothetical protein